MAAKKQSIAESVAKQFRERISMARGGLIVDENVAFLERPLKEQNFHAATPPKGMSDDDIKKKMLFNRVLITKNEKDFEDDAPVYDYGLISLKDLPFIDPAQENNQTAKMISKAWKDFDLHAEKARFKLTLKPNGKHVLKRLA